MSDELKPCPFCGSEAEIVAGNSYPGEKVVRCTGCRAGTDEDYMSYSAADLWNERIDEGLREAVARLVGAAALYDTDTDLEPGEDLTITVTYDDQRALREALSGLVAAHPDLKP